MAQQSEEAAPPPSAPPPLLFFRFSGSGWLLSFHCGVGKFLQEHLDTDGEQLRYGGESGGALVAAALALGMDMEEFWESSLELYEPCKSNPFKMSTGMKKTLKKICPGDAAWVAASGRLVVGVSTLDRQGLSFAWKPAHMSTFRDRKHGIRALLASCHLPVVGGLSGLQPDGPGGARCFDGGMAEPFPEVLPEVLLKRWAQQSAGASAASTAADGAALPPQIFHLDTCAWGNQGEGYDICPGFEVPIGWFFFPSTPGMLRKLFRLGYLRAKELFCRISPQITHNLWRQTASASSSADVGCEGPTNAHQAPAAAPAPVSASGSRPAAAPPGLPSPFKLEQLAAVRKQIAVLIHDLQQAEVSGCIDCLLGFRKQHSAPALPQRGAASCAPPAANATSGDFMVPYSAEATAAPPLLPVSSRGGGGGNGGGLHLPRMTFSGAVLGMVAKQYKAAAAAAESSTLFRIPVEVEAAEADVDGEYPRAAGSVSAATAASASAATAASAAAAATAAAARAIAAAAAARVAAAAASAAAAAPSPRASVSGIVCRTVTEAQLLASAETPPQHSASSSAIFRSRSVPSFVELREYSLKGSLPNTPTRSPAISQHGGMRSASPDTPVRSSRDRSSEGAADLHVFISGGLPSALPPLRGLRRRLSGLQGVSASSSTNSLQGGLAGAASPHVVTPLGSPLSGGKSVAHYGGRVSPAPGSFA